MPPSATIGGPDASRSRNLLIEFSLGAQVERRRLPMDQANSFRGLTAIILRQGGVSGVRKAPLSRV